MMFRLAERMNELKASEIREILKLTQQPEVISFAGGLPAQELFPTRELVAVTAEALIREGHKVLQYSTTEGCSHLRKAVAERMNRLRATRVEPDNILITAGSQQGLDLTGKLFLDPGDAVLCESPTYLGAVNAFKAYSPRFLEVPTDDHGMNLAALEDFLKAEPKAKFIYVVPDFQNPTGRTWSLERRMGLVEIADHYGVPVIEDNPYADLRFEGEPFPSVKSFDRNGIVVHLGTFSKIFCPGLRIGWVSADRSLLEKYVLAKQGVDLHTSTLGQSQLRFYLEGYDIDQAIIRLREVYRGRRDAMLNALDETMPECVSYTRPQGGLFLWMELPETMNARDLLVESVKENVAFVPGGSFFPNGGHENTLRLNFSAASEERIVEGIHRLAGVIRRLLANNGCCEAAIA